jgi:hypothetical protein
VPLTNPDDALLPPAVPAYDTDVSRLHEHLGQLTVYNLQLTQLLRERAVEANRIHDQLEAAQARIAELDQVLAGREGAL